MTNTITPLTSEALLEHARTIARVDEQRHGLGTTGVPPSHHSEETLRGWGNAALLDLEWSSHHIYTRAEHRVYRSVYAEEFQRARAARTVEWADANGQASASHRRPTSNC